ncbi:MAG: Asp-tRNA(Asn)/Glu-tRNA(Gln) amidotransferase subunit GatC [Alphaproteobacteria bacterium]
MSMDKATVATIARLARIALSDDEKAHLAKELSSILTWIERLNEVDTDVVAPMASVVAMTLPRRSDAVTDGDIADKIVANAPERRDGYFVVPKVVE